MNRNRRQTAKRNFAGIIHLRRILPDCVLFLVPLLLLALFLPHPVSGGNPEEYRGMFPVPAQYLTAADTAGAVMPLPDYLTGTFRKQELWLSSDRPRFYLGRPDPPISLELETPVIHRTRSSICIKDRVLTNCRKFLKFSLHVRAGPDCFSDFRELTGVHAG